MKKPGTRVGFILFSEHRRPCNVKMWSVTTRRQWSPRSCKRPSGISRSFKTIRLEARETHGNYWELPYSLENKTTVKKHFFMKICSTRAKILSVHKLTDQF